MLFSLVLPLLAGALGVLQNAVNRRFADSLSLPFALVVNSVVLLVASGVLYGAVRVWPADSLPEIFRPRAPWGEISPSHLLPGLFGFTIITVLPWAIQRVGATRVFIGIVVAQIAVSLLWDLLAENLPLSPARVLGATLALAGAVVASLR